MSETLQCDVAIIGAGTAGLSAYKAASKAGAAVLLIESGPGGTTCTRNGCMPSKLLLAAAGIAANVARAARFGIELPGGMRIDGAAVMRRVRENRDYFTDAVLQEYQHFPASDRVHGRARFIGPSVLKLDDGRRVEANAIVIATGARSAVPELLRKLGDRLLTNENVFALETLPRSIAVVGAGPLGIEFADAFSRLGVKVTVFDTGDAIGGLVDPAVIAAARRHFAAGLNLQLKVEITHAEPQADRLRLHWKHSIANGGQAQTAEFEYLLIAAGRPPELKDLELAAAGIKLDKHGVPIADPATLRCGKSPVFIAGDADHRQPVLHEAVLEGAIAGENAAHYPQVKSHPRTTRLAIVFTSPGIATVGDSWKPLDPDETEYGEVSFEDTGRARVEDQQVGLLRVYARRTDRVLLGGEMFAPATEHLAQLLALAVDRRMTAEQLMDVPAYHPTYEEQLHNALKNLITRLDASERDARQSI